MIYRGENHPKVVTKELDSTVADGDPVRLDVDTGHYAILIAGSTGETKQIDGWAMASGVAGNSIPILLQTESLQVQMTLENALSTAGDLATLAGVRVGLIGTTGAFFVDNDDYDEDVIAVEDVEPDSTTKVWVIPASYKAEAVS